eukprot:4145179-Ditylum_brightwellii.AAC.1
MATKTPSMNPPLRTRDDGVDNNASVQQTSEAAVMNKLKNFDTVRSNMIPQNTLNGMSNTSEIRDEEEILWQRKLDLAYGSMDEKEKKSDGEKSIIEPSYNRKEIESSNNASEIIDEEEFLWRRKLNLAYGSMDGKEKKSEVTKNKDNSDASEIKDKEEILWQRKLNLAYGSRNQEVETPTKKPAIKSTSVAWQRKIKRKVPNGTPSVIDPDAPQVEEPPLPWRRDHHSQLDSFADEPSITHEDNVGDAQPTTDDN